MGYATLFPVFKQGYNQFGQEEKRKGRIGHLNKRNRLLFYLAKRERIRWEYRRNFQNQKLIDKPLARMSHSRLERHHEFNSTMNSTQPRN